MTWATPLLAAAAAAIAVPALVILYFLRLRRRSVEVSTTLLWKKAIQDLQANAPFQRLRRNILLFLQLLVLAAVLLAIAQPQLSGQALQGQRHIILIDRSASMSALDGDGSGASRLAAAKARAIAMVDGMREPGLFLGGTGDEAMVIAFSISAEVRHQFTSDKASLRRAIEAIEPTDAPSLLDEAMRLARAHAPRRRLTELNPDGTESQMEIEGLYQGPGSTLHLFSDGALPDASRVLPASTDTVVYHAIGGSDAANVGITSIRAQRDYERPEELSIFVGISSTGSLPRTVDVQLSLADANVLGVRRIELPAAARIVEEFHTDPDEDAGDPFEPGSGPPRPPRTVSSQRWQPSSSGVVFNLTRAEAGMFSVRLLPVGESGPPNLLETDDVAWLAVPPARQLAVAIVTTGNVFLRGLEGLPLARLETLAPDDWSALDPAARASFDVVILDRWLPPGPLPPGQLLVLGGVPTTDTGIIDRGVAPEGSVGIIIDWRRDHPAMRDLSLDPLQIVRPRMVSIEPESTTRPLAEGDFGPAILEYSRDQTRAIIVPFDPVASTWPFDISWVVFLAAAVDYLGHGAGSSAGARMIQPGSVLSDRLPTGAANVEVLLPGGATALLEPAADGRVVYGPIPTSGIYALRWTGPASSGDVASGSRAVRAFAANLADQQESDIAARDVLPLANQVAVASAQARAQGLQQYWPWLILAALAVMLFEWWVYNRKVYL